MKCTAMKPLLLVAFFLSGCSGLMYQTVWVRMLTRYLGATTHATATVLVVFMAGLAMGSLIGGRLADRTRRFLLGYGLLELAIGGAGLLASFAVIGGLSGWYVEMYRLAGGQAERVLAVRVLFVLACLLPPTMLMGATLPLLVAFVTRLEHQFQSGLGGLYALNTYGAAAGVLLTGLVLLGEFGETATLIVAATLNGVSALVALALWRLGPSEASSVETTDEDAVGTPAPSYPFWIRRLALITFFVSGMTALAYEVLWARLLVPFLQTSIYAFSAMLATFLIGIALGSWDSRRRQDVQESPLATFGLLEVIIGFWAVVGLLVLAPLYRFGLPDQLGMLTCLVVVLPAAFFFGLQFPVAVRCCMSSVDQPGQLTGRAYGANTCGAITGSVAAGFFLIPLLGTAGTVLALAALNIVLGSALLAVAPRAEWGSRRRIAGVLAVLVLGAVPFVGDPYQRIMGDRIRAMYGPEGQMYAYCERPTATTVAAGNATQPLDRALLVNGMGMTSLFSETKLMAHLPYQLAEKPQRLLVICFGMGTTFRSACQYDGLQVDVVDIVPDVFDCFQYFHSDIDRYRNRPKTQFHVDDGRNYLLTRPERYDVITIDPAPPVYSAGTVNLYSREFFALCKARLTPGGAFCLWLPADFRSELLMIMKSFQAVFPEASLWGGLKFPGFYLIGGHHPLTPTPAQLNQLADRLAGIPDLGEWDASYRQPTKLKELFLLDAAGLRRLTASAPEVTDDRPYTEFFLWRQLHSKDHAQIFDANILRSEREAGKWQSQEAKKVSGY
jgi:spermidine synthase